MVNYNFEMLPIDGPIRKSAINESKIEYVDLNANPIQGCSHACKYCYARDIDLRFGKVKSAVQWHKPKYFKDYLNIVKMELETNKIDREREIFLCTMTDLYQPYAMKHDIGRKLISLLQDYECTYRVLTKSPEIVKDIELFENYNKGKIGLSITTDTSNELYRKKWEPRTESIQKRLEALNILAKHGGINLWVSAEPFLPYTDFNNYFDEILNATGDSLTELIMGKMNYQAGVDNLFDWKNVIQVSEKYRVKNKDKIRFHYKKEFWNYLTRHQVNPVQLGISPKLDFVKCYY